MGFIALTEFGSSGRELKSLSRMRGIREDPGSVNCYNDVTMQGGKK